MPIKVGVVRGAGFVDEFDFDVRAGTGEAFLPESRERPEGFEKQFIRQNRIRTQH